jgi:hypothetical protein
MSFFEHLIQALAFPFKDPQWVKKLGIGFLLGLGNSIVPLLPALILSGYCYKIMRRVIVEGGDPYLPEWEDWSTLLSDGLKLWGAGIVYSLPILVLVIPSMIFFMLSGIALPFLIDSSGRMPIDSDMLILGPFLIGAGIMCLGAPLGLLINLVKSPGMGHLAAKGEFSAAFRIREIWPILKAGIGPYLIILVANLLLSFIFTAIMQVVILTLIFAILYPALLGLYIFLVMLYNHTFEALAYREALRRLAGTAS